MRFCSVADLSFLKVPRHQGNGPKAIIQLQKSQNPGSLIVYCYVKNKKWMYMSIY